MAPPITERLRSDFLSKPNALPVRCIEAFPVVGGLHDHVDRHANRGELPLRWASYCPAEASSSRHYSGASKLGLRISECIDATKSIQPRGDRAHARFWSWSREECNSQVVRAAAPILDTMLSEDSYLLRELRSGLATRGNKRPIDWSLGSALGRGATFRSAGLVVSGRSGLV
jgi:hypothetical protein